MIGTLTWWSRERNFGFIEVRIPKTFGTQLDTYFLHRTSVRFTTLDEPKVGCIVKFEPGENQGKKFPLALDAKIFETAEQLQAAESAVQQ